MGVWGRICSVGSSIVSGIGSAIGGACSIMGTAIGTIGSALSKVGELIGGTIGSKISELGAIISEFPIGLKLEDVVKIVGKIAEIVVAICESLGLRDKEDDTAEELGVKAAEADKKPEDFDSINEYIDYLQNDIKIDKEKMEKLTKEEKLACTAIGSMILADAISESKGVDVNVSFLTEVAKQGLSAKEVEKYIDNFKKNKSDLNMSEYLKGELSAEENKKTSNIIYETVKELNPGLSDAEIEEKVDKMIEIAVGE